MYRCGLKEYIREELKLYKSKTIKEVRHATLIIEKKYKLRKTPYANNEIANKYSKGLDGAGPTNIQGISPI